MRKNIQGITGFLLLLLMACSSTKQSQLKLVPVKPASLQISGRTLKNKDGSVTLASSAAACRFSFAGEQCTVYLQNVSTEGDYNYVNIEVDGSYKGRFAVKGNQPLAFPIKAASKADKHQAVISKATEAANGQVIITAVEGETVSPGSYHPAGKIECIGNSITCGFGNDLEIPCGNGSKWYDQHNAYWSYASIVARENKLDLMISAISGAGIYRHWNTDSPTVPGRYDNALLNEDSTKKWDFKSYIPDVVTIALGTNDISDGDGKTPRLPFDKNTYVTAYKKFIQRIYAHYGKQVQLVLLNSPMVGGERGRILEDAILTVKNTVNAEQKPVKPVQTFFFKPMSPTGCTYHPSIEEHRIMAEQLAPFIKTLL